MRDLTNRLAALERQARAPVEWSDEQWDRLSLEEVEALACLPALPDGRWNVKAWTEDQIAFANALADKATGVAA